MILRICEKKRYINVNVRKQVNILFTFVNTYLRLKTSSISLPESSTVYVDAETRKNVIEYLNYLQSSLKALKSKNSKSYTLVCSKYNEVVNRDIPLNKIVTYAEC